jgi:hypothetical protein
MSIGSKIFKGVLGKLTGDTPTKITGALPDEAPKVSRRGVLTGMAAAPVAGALGELPISKIISDVAPVAKVAKKIPLSNLNISSLSAFKNRFDEAIEMAMDEGREFDTDLIREMEPSEFMEEIVYSEMGGLEDFDGSLLEGIVNEIKEKYPDATDQEIFNKLSESVEDLDKLIPQSKLKYKATE